MPGGGGLLYYRHQRARDIRQGQRWVRKSREIGNSVGWRQRPIVTPVLVWPPSSLANSKLNIKKRNDDYYSMPPNNSALSSPSFLGSAARGDDLMLLSCEYLADDPPCQAGQTAVWRSTLPYLAASIIRR
jgi:hypothetical protein